MSPRTAAAARRTLSGGLGSTTQLTDSAGAVTDSYAYDVFGAPRAVTGTTPNDFRYTGQQDDRNANRGLYYLRARAYDPSLGRFLQQDPLPLLNRYTYAGGNPTNRVDPAGLAAEDSQLSENVCRFGLNIARGVIGYTYIVSASARCDRPVAALAVAVSLIEVDRFGNTHVLAFEANGCGPFV